MEEIKSVLLAAGEVFHGGRVDDIAKEWFDHDFDAPSVARWVEARCWCPITASQLADAGFRPGKDVLSYLPGKGRNYGYGIDPMYALCNGDSFLASMRW